MNPADCLQTLAASRIEGFTFEALRCRFALNMPFHSHDHAHFVLVLAGHVTDSRRHNRFHRGAGWLSYIPAGEVHATECCEGCDMFQFAIEPGVARRYNDIAPQLDRPVDSGRGVPNWLAERMHSELMHGDTLSPMMLHGLGLELLASICRVAPFPAAGASPRWLKTVQDYLHTHFADGPSIEELARIVGVHPAHLMRCFRREYRCTVGEYVRTLRLDYARQLLANSDSVLSHVALSAGFSDQSHFIRTFRASTGMTPTAYREGLRKATSVHRMQA